MDGIKAFMSPRTPEPTGRLDIKKRSGASITDGVEKTECESGIKRADVQPKGDSIVVNGKRPPTAGRGRRTPEQSPPGSGGGCPQVKGAKNIGQLVPGNGHLETAIQSISTGSRGTVSQGEDNRLKKSLRP